VIVHLDAHVPPYRVSADHRQDGDVLIAHAAHWLNTLAYFSPVVGIAVWLIASQQRERRQARRGG
jgi:hypothetical protein